ILLLPPEYPIEVQALIPIVLCVVHNIILSHSQTLDDSTQLSTFIEQEDHGGSGNVGEGHDDELAFHDAIAEAMWNDYQNHLWMQGEI
ncbi:hypothetical protein PISMIDRAFT_118978, partial [Pisolithus microcarpus 441]